MSDLAVRDVTAEDVPAIVAMLVDDPLGVTRESPDDLTPYLEAVEAISADPQNRVLVAERDGEVIATMQLTYIRGLGRRGRRSRPCGSVRTCVATGSARS